MQMRVVKLSLVAFALVATVVRSDDSDEFEGESPPPTKKKGKTNKFVLEHSFSSDAQGFKARSKFEVEIATETKITNGPVSVTDKKGEKQATVAEMESYTFSPQEVKVFQELVQNDGYYRVRVRSDPNTADSPYVISVIQACQLLVSNFEEVFTLHLDKKGLLVGLDFQASHGHQSCMGNAEVPNEVDLISSATALLPTESKEIKIKQVGPAAGAQPQQMNQPPPGVEAVHDEKNPPKPAEQSFFRKYWYIIVPAVVFMMFGGPDEEPAGAKRAAGPPGAAGKSAGVRKKK